MITVMTFPPTPLTAPGDYTAITDQEITFAPNEFTMTVTVTIGDDNIVEVNEMFFGRLTTTDPLVQVTEGEATITILDEVDSTYA